MGSGPMDIHAESGAVIVSDYAVADHLGVADSGFITVFVLYGVSVDFLV